MEVKMLDKKYHVNSDSGCTCRYVRSDTEYFRPHYHNFYELFMVVKGNICHMINSNENILSVGELIFIRDFDVHDYKSADGKYFEFVNLSFTKETLNSTFDYLEDRETLRNLLSVPNPPSVQLPEREAKAFFYSLMELSRGVDPSIVKKRMKTLLVIVFTKYFMNYTSKKDIVPLWLEVTFDKMKKPENFIAGTKRLYEISNHSREHLSRSLKKYYGTTPSELVNDFRLEYCARLLVTSNLSVTDICFECGFENISWFYKAFFKKYGETPGQYRKTH